MSARNGWSAAWDAALLSLAVAAGSGVGAAEGTAARVGASSCRPDKEGNPHGTFPAKAIRQRPQESKNGANGPTLATPDRF
jgi:hypothetical protein